MAVLAECPKCHRLQSIENNEVCINCKFDLRAGIYRQRVPLKSCYRVNKKLITEPAGFKLKDALAMDGKRKAQKRENRINSILGDTEPFSKLSKWYLGRPKVKRTASYGRSVIALNRFNAEFGGWQVGKIKLADLEDYQDRLEDEGLKPSTIDTYISVAARVVNMAWKNDKITDRPVRAFQNLEKKLQANANKRKDILEVSDILALIKNASDHLKPMVIVAVHTGMRDGEIRKLRRSHVDLKEGFIRLPAEITKTKKERKIPINPYVREVLRQLPHALHYDYVFTYNGKPFKEGGDCRNSMATACEAAGIPYGRKVEGGFTFHDLRATFDTFMDRAGVRESSRKAIMGHSLRGMDERYLRIQDRDLREAMDKFTAWFEAEIEKCYENVESVAVEAG